MQRWTLLLLLACALAGVVALRKQQEQISEARARLEDYMRSAEGLGEITIRKGRDVWVIVQGPHESVERWLTRAWAKRNEAPGVPPVPGELCADFVCNGDDVHLCVGCMVNEPPEDCQERLDEAVALYKRIAGC